MDYIEATPDLISGKSGKSGIGARCEEDSAQKARRFINAAAAAGRLINMEDQRIESWVPILVDALRAQVNLQDSSIRKYVREAKRLLSFLCNSGAETWADATVEMVAECAHSVSRDTSGEFVDAAHKTVSNRRSAARKLFELAEQLGADIDAHELSDFEILGDGASKPSRPLNEQETRQLQRRIGAELVTSMLTVIVALAFAGGSAPEIAAVRPSDIDLEGRTVRFRGKSLRLNPLPKWPADTIAAHFANRQPPPPSDEPLCVGAWLSGRRAAQSVTSQLKKALDAAALAPCPGVTAISIRRYAAQGVAQHSGLDAAARLLGYTSRDRAAAAIGWPPLQYPHETADA